MIRTHTPQVRAAFREAVARQLRLWEAFRDLEKAAGQKYLNLDHVVANASIGIVAASWMTDEFIDESMSTLEESE